MDSRITEIKGELNGEGLRIALVASQFNEEIVSGLIEGATSTLTSLGTDEISLIRVPGAFELPSACRLIALEGRHDAVIALGAVVKGDSDHYQYICDAVTRGLAEVALHSPVPVLFGVLTTQNEELALKRCNPHGDNKGGEVAKAAIEMVSLFNRLREIP